MNMYQELQNAVVKAEKLNIKAFEVTVLAENGKVFRLSGNAGALNKAKMTLVLAEQMEQQRAKREQKINETFVSALFEAARRK